MNPRSLATFDKKAITDKSKKLEHYVTPKWAIDEILKRELMTRLVVDPCTGTGVLADAARKQGYQVHSSDVFNWDYDALDRVVDFLDPDIDTVLPAWMRGTDFTVFINPPFSKAVDFVKRAFELGARKVVCFQRFAWYESFERKAFWDEYPPQRIYLCGHRATCWRYDLYEENKGKQGSPTAHAWFVWERGQPQGPIISRIYKS